MDVVIFAEELNWAFGVGTLRCPSAKILQVDRLAFALS